MTTQQARALAEKIADRLLVSKRVPCNYLIAAREYGDDIVEFGQWKSRRVLVRQIVAVLTEKAGE